MGLLSSSNVRTLTVLRCHINNYSSHDPKRGYFEFTFKPSSAKPDLYRTFGFRALITLDSHLDIRTVQIPAQTENTVALLTRSYGFVVANSKGEECVDHHLPKGNPGGVATYFFSWTVHNGVYYQCGGKVGGKNRERI